MATGKNDYTAGIAESMAGLALGLFTGVGFISSAHSVLHGISSNIYVDKNQIFFASMNELVCFDTSGIKIWKYILPKDSVSKSFLFSKDSLLILVNYGYGFFNSKRTNYGHKMILCFNKYTGQLKCYTKLNIPDFISSIKIKNGYVFLLLKNRICKWSLNDAKITDERTFDDVTFGEIDYCADEAKIYLSKNDSVFKPLSKTDSSGIYLVNKKSDVLILDKYLRNNALIPFDSIYIFRHSYKDIKFLNKNGKTFIMNDLFENAGVVNVNNLFASGNKLFSFHEQTLTIIDPEKLKQH